MDVVSNNQAIAFLLVCAVGAVCLFVMMLALLSISRRQRIAENARLELERLVATLQIDQRRFLTSDHLGPLYDKLNAMARELAESRAELRASNEQLRVIRDYMMKSHA